MNPPAPGRATPVVLAVAMAMFAIVLDSIVPALPSIRRDFGTDIAATQLVMSGLVIGFAIAQVVIGPISDRYGRRPVLVAGWIIFVLASIGCALAPTLEWLVLARVVQALGCCAPVVVGRAMVRDLYGVGHTARMLGIIMSIGALPMFAAPWAGGVIQQHFGWRWNFGWLAAFGALMLVLSVALLGETHRHRDPRATDLRRMLANYATLVRDRRFLAHALVAVGNFSMIFTFLSGASFVIITLLGLSPGATGLLIGLGTVGFAVTSLAASRLVTDLGTTRLITIGAWITLPAALVMAGLAIAEVHTVAALMLPYFAILIGVGFTNASSVAGAIGPFPQFAGTASSLLGLAQFVIGGTLAYVVSRFHDGTPLATTLGVSAGALLIFVVVYGMVRPLKA